MKHREYIEYYTGYLKTVNQPIIFITPRETHRGTNPRYTEHLWKLDYHLTNTKTLSMYPNYDYNGKPNGFTYIFTNPHQQLNQKMLPHPCLR